MIVSIVLTGVGPLCVPVIIQTEKAEKSNVCVI